MLVEARLNSQKAARPCVKCQPGHVPILIALTEAIVGGGHDGTGAELGCILQWGLRNIWPQNLHARHWIQFQANLPELRYPCLPELAGL